MEYDTAGSKLTGLGSSMILFLRKWYKGSVIKSIMILSKWPQYLAASHLDCEGFHCGVQSRLRSTPAPGFWGAFEQYIHASSGALPWLCWSAVFETFGHGLHDFPGDNVRLIHSILAIVLILIGSPFHFAIISADAKWVALTSVTFLT